MARYLTALLWRAFRWVGWAKGMLLALTPLIPTEWFARLGIPVREEAIGKTLAYWAFAKLGLAWSVVVVLLLVQWILLRAAHIMYREAAPTVRTVPHLGLLWGRGPDGENVTYCPSCKSQKGGPYPLHLPMSRGFRSEPESGGVATAMAVELICHHPSHRKPARFSIDQDRYFQALTDLRRTESL